MRGEVRGRYPSYNDGQVYNDSLINGLYVFGFLDTLTSSRHAECRKKCVG